MSAEYAYYCCQECGAELDDGGLEGSLCEDCQADLEELDLEDQLERLLK